MKAYPVHPYIKFKAPYLLARTERLCDTAMEVLYEMAEYCEERELPFVITDSVSTKGEDVKLARVSDEHSTGRAFDISLNGFLDLALKAFVANFEQRFLSVAAIGKKSGLPRLIFIHDNGNGKHIHVQVARIYGLSNPLGDLDESKVV